jgi:hypothetical protein
MLTTLWANIKTYAEHFILVLLLVLGLYGFIRHEITVRELNEKLYQLSKANGSLIISTPPKKSIVDHIIDKKVLPVAPVPKGQISEVVAVVEKSTGCPAIGLTILKNGDVVSNSPGVSTILVENYADNFFGTDLQLRGAGLLYAGEKGYKVSGDAAIQASYWRIWRLYPDATVGLHSIGGGISYHHAWGIFKNTYGGLGYSYHWNEGYWGPYASASLRF